MAQVQIIEVGQTELLHVYPGQQHPQAVHVFLDCRSGRFGAEYDAEIGNAVSFDEYHGHIQTWPIAILAGGAVNAMLAALAPLAQRVLDGYSAEWNGNNMIATFDADASAALDEIADALDDDDDCDNPDRLHWAEAQDWLYDVRADLRAQLAEGKTVDALYDELQGDGADEDRPVLVSLRDYLDSLATSVAAGKIC